MKYLPVAIGVALALFWVWRRRSQQGWEAGI